MDASTRCMQFGDDIVADSSNSSSTQALETSASPQTSQYTYTCIQLTPSSKDQPVSRQQKNIPDWDSANTRHSSFLFSGGHIRSQRDKKPTSMPPITKSHRTLRRVVFSAAHQSPSWSFSSSKYYSCPHCDQVLFCTPLSP